MVALCTVHVFCQNAHFSLEILFDQLIEGVLLEHIELAILMAKVVP